MENENAHTDFESLCAGYVLGALDESEQARFETMLEEASPEQEAFYRDLCDVRDELALAADPEPPSDAVETRLMTSIGSAQGASSSNAQPDFDEPSGASPASQNAGLGTGQRSDRAPDREASRRAASRSTWAYKLAAVLLLAVSIGLAYLTLDLRSTVSDQQAVITQLESEVQQQEELLTVLAAREAQLINMGGLDASPEGYGKIVWAPTEGRAVLQMANLPPPPEDKDYQLWLIKDEQAPISAGVFHFDQSRRDLFFVVDQLDAEPSPSANAFAVTLEPEGGMPQPTGDMFLLGQQV